MIPPSRPLQSLLGVSRWGSRPRPRHAFHSQHHLFYATKNRSEGFPYRDLYGHLKRKELLRRLGFPRDYGPPLSKNRWTEEDMSQLLVTLVYYVVRFPFWRMKYPREPLGEGVVVKDRIGRLFCGFVLHSDCRKLMNAIIRRWGILGPSSGRSMLPTLGANVSIVYISYAYNDKKDIRPGHVVNVMGSGYDEAQGTMNKRVVALEGKRVYVYPMKNHHMPRIVKVPMGHCFVVGDNPSKSIDSRQFGPIPIEAVWGQIQWTWGLDGWFRPNHDEKPWETNKSVAVLPPGQNSPTDAVAKGGPSIK